MATKMKKTLSLALALIMVLGMLPLTAFAAENTPSGVGSTWVDVAHGNAVIEDANHINHNEDDGVTTEKTAKRTNNENEFEIQLKVTTKENLSQLQIAPDAAVVLVVDTSGSMAKYVEGTTTRMKSVQNILANNTDSFLNKYADVNGAKDVRRMVSIVDFASNAKAEKIGGQYWANVAVEAGLENAKAVINGFEADGGTNIEGGLQLAYNLLTNSKLSDPVKNITNRYVILLTDGVPTYHLDGDNSTSVTKFTGVEGGGTKAELEDYQDIPTIATDIKNEGNAKLQAVAYGNVSSETIYKETVEHKCNAKATTTNGWHNHDKDDREKNGYGDGKRGYLKLNNEFKKTQYAGDYGWFEGPHTGETQTGASVTVEKWLKDDVKINDLYTPADADKLAEDFANIVENIQKLAQAWIVTDPMGADVEYVGDASKDAPIVGVKDGTLTWYMMKDQPEADGKGNYTYTLTYKVKLLNEKQGFADGEENLHPTNGQTTLKYVVKTGDKLGDLTPIDFYVPTVWGTVPTLNYSIEYYLQKNGQYELQSNATKNGSAPMHTEVKLDVVDEGYLNKYDAQNYHWVKSDPATVTLTEDGTVLRVYYDHDTVKIPVNYFLATKTTDKDGNVTNGDYAVFEKVENYSKIVTVNKGEKYTAEHLTTKEGYQTCTYLRGDHEVMVTDGTEAINLYYKLDADERETTTVDVKYQVNNYTWALKQQENGEKIYEKTLVAGTVQDYQTVQNVRTPSQFTQSVDTLRTDKTLPASEYLLTAATLVQGGTTSQLDTDSDPLSFATKKGGNTLTLVFEKISEAPAETPATLTVTHNYVKDVTIIKDGKTERDQVAHVPFTTNPAGSATWYVGETHLINADQTKPSDGADTYLVDGESSKLVVLTAADNTDSFSYKLIKVPEATTATVNFIYRTYEKVTVEENGIKVEKTQLLGTPVTHSIQVPLTGDTLYENQYVKIPTDTEKLDGYTFNEADSTQNYTAIPAVEKGGTVINLYYDNDNTVDHRYAEVTVTHTYTATKTTVNAQGVVVTETVQEGTVTDPVYTGTAGEKMFNKDIVQLDHDGNTYVRTDTTPLDGKFAAGTNSTINLTYHRVDTSELKGATYQANYEYYDWTMTVDANGVAGYHEGAGYVKNATLSNSTAVINTTEAGDPLYAGMHVQLKGSTDDNYQVVGAPQMERILTEGNNVYTLTFVKQIPLASATVTVNHHYERTTKNEIGVESKEESDFAGTAAPTTLYVGAQVSVSARMDGYPKLESITVTDADGAAVEYTLDASHNIVFTATGTDSVVFSYSDYVDHSVAATYLIQHFYRTVDWDGTTVVEGYKADDTKKQSGTTYATLNKSATPDLIIVDGNPTYTLTDITWTGCDTPVHNNETYTMQLKPGENTLNFYYTKTVDTRPVVKVTVNHVYRVTDPNAPDGFVQEAVVSELKDAKTPGQYIAEKKTDRADGDKTIHYTFDSSDHEDCKLVVTTVESNNVINLYYTRAYGEGEGFPVSGTKTYVGLTSDQYPITTVYLSQAGVQKYSATVNNTPDGNGHFLFDNVAPGVYDISESASVAGYSYTAKYELTAHSYGQEVPSPQLRALVQGKVDITSNPQITVVAKTEYNLEITNTYTSNPTPPPTPGTTYYGITVKYVDEAGKELSAAHTERHYEGYSYDVTDKTTLQIADYTIKSVTGDTLAGRLNGDKVITVVYAPVVVIPDEPVPEGGKPGEVILPDTEPPKNELPEELEDGAVPLDAAPKTGDTTSLWTTLMAVSGFGLAALAIFKGKKKEEDSAE